MVTSVYGVVHVSLIAIGSIKTSWITEGCQEFTKRIERSFSYECIELPASKQKDPAKQQQEECERILKALKSTTGEVWVLDERGDQKTSKQFAGALEKKKDAGIAVTFVIGGAYGLNDAIRNRADTLFALSTMTFAHGLCRLFFLEQLYRAGEIMRGSGYHH